MKKRIALLLCLCMLASVLCSCTLIQRIIWSKHLPEEEAEPTAREIFFDSLENAFPKSENANPSVSLMPTQDTDYSINASIANLNINEADIIDSELIIETTAQYDVDSEIIKSDTVFKYKDEAPTLSLICFDDKIVCTDYFGVAIRPSLISGSIYSDAFESSQAVNEIIDYSKAASKLADALKSALENNIDDSLYTVENGDTSIGGREYKNAQIAKFICNDGVIRRIAHEFFDELEKDEAFNLIFGETEIDTAILEALDDVREIRITNVIIDKISVGLAIELVTYESNVRVTKAIHASYDENGFTVTTGTVGANREISTKEQSLTVKFETKGEKESFKVTYNAVYDSFTLVEIDGMCRDEHRSGTVTYKKGLEYISFDYSFKLDENDGFIDISNFRQKNKAESNEKYNFAFQYNFKDGNKKYWLDFNIAAETEIGNISAEGSIAIEEKQSSVTLTAPTVYDPELTTEYYNSRLKEYSPEFYGIFERLYDAVIQGIMSGVEPFEMDLPDDFEVYEAEDGYLYAYGSPYAYIAVRLHERDSFGDFENQTSKYIAETLKSRYYYPYSPGDIYCINDVYYFEFTVDFEEENASYTYLECVFKGDSGFWEIQMNTSALAFEDYRESFIEWSQSASVLGREPAEVPDSY